MRTRKPWPENAMPTAAQWTDWFLACTPDERQEIAASVLHNSEAAHRCFLEDHDGLNDAILRQLRSTARYRSAWRSARRRGWWLVWRLKDEAEARERDS